MIMINTVLCRAANKLHLILIQGLRHFNRKTGKKKSFFFIDHNFHVQMRKIPACIKGRNLRQWNSIHKTLSSSYTIIKIIQHRL